MLNEVEEFRAYTEPPVYKADSKRDTTYMGRFTMEMILEFVGFTRVLTILARGYLFSRDGIEPREQIEYARRALCAWCSVPDKKKASPKEGWQFKSDFRELHEEFPELVDENGVGWFCRHVHNIAKFLKDNPGKAHKAAYSMVEVIDKDFDSAWRKKVVQLQVPMFSQSTKGSWLLRFDDVLADALELGPLRNSSFDLPVEVLKQIEEHKPKEMPMYVITTLIKYYVANKPEDSDFVVLPVTNFDAYFGSTTFSKKWKHLIPDSLIIRAGESMGVTKYRVNPALLQE